jgi:hypothetical protein
VAIAALKELKPVLIKEGEGETEAITIEIRPKNFTISCTSTYGPQTRKSLLIKKYFWNYLDEEVDRADKEGKGFVLQGDLNARLGSDEIPNDPNPQNENGRLFSEFLKRHPQLTVVNSLDLCKGLITRRRVLCTGKVENAVLDFFVVCSCVLPFVTEMTIHDNIQHILTNYNPAGKGEKATYSDHFTDAMKASFAICPSKPTKNEILNFKNEKELGKFNDLTNKTTEFTECLKGNRSTEVKTHKWRNLLNVFCKKAFRKIRIKRQHIKPSNADDLINQRNKLKKKFENEENEEIKVEVNKLKKHISEILQKENVSKAKKFIQFCDKNSSLHMQQVWKLKSHVWPKKTPTLPIAKRNHTGRLISSPNDIKKALFKEFNNWWR